MKQIQVKSHVVLLDNDDFELVKDCRFAVDLIRGVPYVRLYQNLIRISLNQVLFGNKKNKVKHIDKNPLNFCRDNLILITDDYKRQKLKEYHRKNAHKYKERSLKYARANWEKVKKRNARYEKSERGKKMRAAALRKPKRRFQKAKREAIVNRKFQFKIGYRQWFKLIKSGCYYCGIRIDDCLGVGLDRIDNKKGYLIDNVLPCCGKCNRTRHDEWSVEETKIMIDAVMKFSDNKTYTKLCWQGKDDSLVKV